MENSAAERESDARLTLSGGRTELGLDTFGNALWTQVQGCNGFGGCYFSSVVPAQVSGTTNHYVGVTYDDAGDVVNDGRQFTYDPLGMMTSATVGGRTFQYLYTAGDERIGIDEVTNPSSPAYTIVAESS